MTSAPVQLRLILPDVARLDLDEDERDALLSTLRQIVDNDRFPMSPRIRCLRRILDKLRQPAPVPEPFPPPEPSAVPSAALKKPRRR